MKWKTKLNFNWTSSKYYDEVRNLGQKRNFHFEEEPSSKNAYGIARIMREALLSLKFLQSKPQLKKLEISLISFLL